MDKYSWANWDIKLAQLFLLLCISSCQYNSFQWLFIILTLPVCSVGCTVASSTVNVENAYPSTHRPWWHIYTWGVTWPAFHFEMRRRRKKKSLWDSEGEKRHELVVVKVRVRVWVRLFTMNEWIKDNCTNVCVFYNLTFSRKN